MTATKPLTTLEEVLAYRHPGALNRYCKDNHATPAEAEDVFREMLKWLYLCYRSQIDGPEAVPCAIHPEIEKIDWMWHTFILFTYDYACFCEQYFGFFLHHFPVERMEDEPPVDDETLRVELTKQYAFIYDVLGEKTLAAWYDECRYAAKA